MSTALSDAQNRLLQRYEELLAGRGAELGVVAEADRSSIWERHIQDSLRGLAGFGPTDRDAYDLGSGGGLPGIPLAIARPEVRFRLIESQRRRVAWLELVVQELALTNVEVVQARAEAQSDRVDACFARALAPVARCWDLARPLLRPGGRLVYFGGRSLSREAVTNVAAIVRILDDSPLDSSGPLVIISE
jgi:16S rRNA (guanine527-N7)-methyltransferase